VAVGLCLVSGAALAQDRDRDRDRDGRDRDNATQQDDNNRGDRRRERRRPDQQQHQAPQPQTSPQQQDGWDGNRGRDRRGDWNDGRRGRDARDNRFDNRDRRRGNWAQFRRSFDAPRRYRVGVYRAPPGYYYRRWHHGDRLPRAYFARNYWLTNFVIYGLFAPPPGLMWVRYGPDALLIDTYTGEIVQVRYNVFYY